MHAVYRSKTALRLVATVPALLLSIANAHAVPSYARQTGLSCANCHTAFPQLTPFGRSFKLRGYVETNAASPPPEGVADARAAPMSAMIQASYTTIEKKQPDTVNGNVVLPDELSLFYAGRLAPDLGSFIQLTYDGVEDHISLDNTDIRYAREAFANTSNPLVFGLTLNNNPTVQDPWNTVPAWGYPFASSKTAPTPAAAVQLDDELAQQVAGLGAYVFWKNSLYAEATAYGASQIGGNQPPNSTDEDVVDGTAPYWRLAWEHNWGPHSLELGGFGLSVKRLPGGGQPLTGPTNDFRDTAVDAQYQFLGTANTLTFRSAWIHEKQNWDAAFAAGDSSNPSDTLDTWRVNATYLRKRHFGGSLGYFDTNGDTDALLYAPNPVDGSRTGKPDSRGWTAELDYFPWLNTKLALQYTAYNKFNGADKNYDGAGRDASDNNTIFANAWLMF